MQAIELSGSARLEFLTSSSWEGRRRRMRILYVPLGILKCGKFVQ